MKGFTDKLYRVSIGDAPTSNVITAQSPGANTLQVARKGFASPIQVRYPAEGGWSAYGSTSSSSQPTSGVETAQSFTNAMHEHARAAGCPALSGEQPSSDVNTAISFGEQTRNQAYQGNFASQRPMQYPAAADWNAYGQVASSVAAPSSQCLSLSAFSPTATSTPNTSSASSVTTADIYSRAARRYVPTEESLVDIHSLPNPFDVNYVGSAGFVAIRKPSNASLAPSTSQSSMSSNDST
uniref:SH3 domain-containing protein n=1 Tax=Panagrellus redivivus TaxID=6233 RepID=A0A7E4V289_PANRE